MVHPFGDNSVMSTFYAYAELPYLLFGRTADALPIGRPQVVIQYLPATAGRSRLVGHRQTF